MANSGTISPVGRDDEIEAVMGAVDLTTNRRSSCLVVITADPGGGKTTLLQAAGSRARSKGCELVELPVEVLSNEAKGASVVAPPERPPGFDAEAAPGRRAVGASLREYVGARKWTSPTVVVVDDLDRAEPEGLAAMNALMVQLAAAPVTWIVTGRSDADGSASALRGIGDGSRTEIRLGPLGQDAAHDLAASVLAGPLVPALAEIVDAADGNPGMITALAEDYARSVPAGEPTDLAATTCFRAQLRGRIDRASPEASRVLETAAVLGGSFEVDDLAGILAMSVPSLTQILRRVLDAGLLEDAAERIRFRHDCVRRTLLAGLPGPVRAAMHREIARMLLAQDGRLVEAAEHLASGARSSDSSTAGIVREAVESVQHSRPDIAAPLALQALTRYPRSLGHYGVFVAVAARSCTRVGPLSQVVSLGDDASHSLLSSSQLAELRSSLGVASLLQGDVTGATVTADAALAEPGSPKEPTRDAAAVRLWAALDRWSRASPPEPAELSGLVDLDDENLPETDLLNVLAVAAWRSGRVSEAVRHARDALGGASRSSFHAGNDSVLPSMLIRAGRPSDAAALLDEEPARMDRTRSATRKILRGEMFHASGDHHRAESELRAGLELAEHLGMTLHRASGHAALADTAVTRGDLVEAARCIAELARSQPMDSANAGVQMETVARARLADASGDTELLMAALREIDVSGARLVPLLLRDPDNGPFLARAASENALDALATVVADAVVDLAERNPELVGFTAVASHCRGLVTRDRAHLWRALEEYTAPHRRARVEEDLAQLLGGSEAVDLLEDAAATYSGIGAELSVSRTRMKLRALGVRRRHWRRAKRPATGWESLTDRELAIVERVVEGLTNQQIASRLYVSPHTVAYHLRHVFQKLGVRSRTELAHLRQGGRAGPSARGRGVEAGR